MVLDTAPLMLSHIICLQNVAHSCSGYRRRMDEYVFRRREGKMLEVVS